MSLALPKMDDTSAAAAADWLRPLWRAPPGGASARSALAAARSPEEAAAAVARLPRPARAVLSAIAAHSNSCSHADTLAGVLFAREGAEVTGIDGWERREGERDEDTVETMVVGRAALEIVLENGPAVFGPSWQAERRRSSSASANVASHQPTALEVRVATLEAELAAFQSAALRMETRVSELSQNFEFWTRLLLAEVRSTSAVDAAGRAALADAIACRPETHAGASDAPEGSHGHCPSGRGPIRRESHLDDRRLKERRSRSCEGFEITHDRSDCVDAFGDGNRRSVAAAEAEGETEHRALAGEDSDAHAALLLGIKGSSYRHSSLSEKHIPEQAPRRVFRDGQWRTVTTSSSPTARS